MHGIVIKTTGSSSLVWLENQTSVNCYVKGNFRIRGIRTTNPVAIGDRVCVEQQQDGTNWIVDIDERRNYIVRRSTNLSKQAHILAANIDLAMLIVTLHHPVTSLTFIDRFLATAEAYRVPACLLFNKTDLLSEQEAEELAQIRNMYEQIGYPTLALSAIHLAEDALDFLIGKTVLLSGNSGVGKSTLLNALLGEQVARTGKVSEAHDKGMHTTTFSEMYAYKGGWLIDTPGIKGFGMHDMKKEEMSHYFPEIFSKSKQCRFSNCTHTGEPDCAVLKAVEAGEIFPSRFNSYLSMLGDVDENKYR